MAKHVVQRDRVIEEACRLIREGLGEEPFVAAAQSSSPDQFPVDDGRVLDLFRSGDTLGVFQFEGPKMRSLLKACPLGSYEELVTLHAQAIERPVTESSRYGVAQAYRCACLKTHYPVQFMGALLNQQAVDDIEYQPEDRTWLPAYLEECKRILKPDGSRGIEVRGLLGNFSPKGFSVAFDPDEPHSPNHGHILAQA